MRCFQVTALLRIKVQILVGKRETRHKTQKITSECEKRLITATIRICSSLLCMKPKYLTKYVLWRIHFRMTVNLLGNTTHNIRKYIRKDGWRCDSISAYYYTDSSHFSLCFHRHAKDNVVYTFSYVLKCPHVSFSFYLSINLLIWIMRAKWNCALKTNKKQIVYQDSMYHFVTVAFQ